MMSETMFASFDGTQLYLKTEVPTAPRAVAVIVHGLCEHQGRYDYLAARLLAAGYTVYRFDHRGHGRSEGKRVYYGDFNEIADDVNEVVKLAEAGQPGLPLFVVGHSMGGFATALFGTKYPGRARGIVLSGALTRGNEKRHAPPAGPAAAPDADGYLPNALGAGVCSDAAVGEAYAKDPYVEKKISVSLMENLGRGVAWLVENKAQFTDAVLVMHGEEDALVDEKDSRDFYGDIASRDKMLIIFPKLQHEIFNEFEKDKVMAEALEWMNKRL